MAATADRSREAEPESAATGLVAIELEGVSRRYTVGDVTVTALEGVGLRVEPGEFTVILGASGSGKTTLLNVIGALDSPTEGRIVVGGREITGASRKALFRFRRETVGFIFQTFNLFPALTALENVEFGVHVAGRNGGRELAAATLERVGLGARLDHFPHELRAASSSGSRSLARWRPAARCCSRTSRREGSTSRPGSRS